MLLGPVLTGFRGGVFGSRSGSALSSAFSAPEPIASRASANHPSRSGLSHAGQRGSSKTRSGGGMVMLEYTSDPPPTPLACMMFTPSLLATPSRPRLPNTVRSYSPSSLRLRRKQRVYRSTKPRKFSAGAQYCTGWPLPRRKPAVSTSRSCTVPTGVVHQVPRSSISTRSPRLRRWNSRASVSAVRVPPNPVPTTTTA